MKRLLFFFLSTTFVVLIMAACGNHNSSSKKSDSLTADVSLADKDFELLQHPTADLLLGHWICEEDGFYEELFFSAKGVKHLSHNQKEKGISVNDVDDYADYEISSCDNAFFNCPDFLKGAECICLYDKEEGIECGTFVMDASMQIIESFFIEPEHRYIKVEE